MDISRYKSLEFQASLFDELLRGHGHVRTVVGDLAERLTAKLVGGRRHKTDSTVDYCPDVSARGDYYESKACGKSRTPFIYGGRLEKDREFALSNRLLYVIWHHTADTLSVKTVDQLERLVLEQLQAAYVVPFSEISRLCSLATLDKLNSAYGPQGRPEYGTGYRFNLSLLGRWQTVLPEDLV